MQVPSLRFFVFFVARSGVALWTPFFNYVWLHFGSILGSQNQLFWGHFLDPQKSRLQRRKRRDSAIPGREESTPEQRRGGVGEGETPPLKIAKKEYIEGRKDGKKKRRREGSEV